MRLFVAIYPPDGVRDHLREMVSTLGLASKTAPGYSLRMTSPEQWHITLAFVGELPDERVVKARRAVAAACAMAPPCEVLVSGGGCFGRGTFTTIWAAVTGDISGLRTISRTVRARLRAERVPFDRKPLRPHITLARPGQRMTDEAIRADLEALSCYQGLTWRVDRACLVSSNLGPRISHETIAEWPLGGGSLGGQGYSD